MKYFVAMTQLQYSFDVPQVQCPFSQSALSRLPLSILILIHLSSLKMFSSPFYFEKSSQMDLPINTFFISKILLRGQLFLEHNWKLEEATLLELQKTSGECMVHLDAAENAFVISTSRNIKFL